MKTKGMSLLYGLILLFFVSIILGSCASGPEIGPDITNQNYTVLGFDRGFSSILINGVAQKNVRNGKILILLPGNYTIVTEHQITDPFTRNRMRSTNTIQLDFVNGQHYGIFIDVQNAAIARNETDPHFGVIITSGMDSFARHYAEAQREAPERRRTVVEGAFDSKGMPIIMLGQIGRARASLASGNAHRANEDFDSAIADYNEALRLFPGYHLAFFNRGIAFSQTGEYELALADLRECLLLDPNNETALYHLGLVHYARREYDLAAAALEAAIRIRPDYTDAENALGEVRQAMR